MFPQRLKGIDASDLLTHRKTRMSLSQGTAAQNPERKGLCWTKVEAGKQERENVLWNNSKGTSFTIGAPIIKA